MEGNNEKVAEGFPGQQFSDLERVKRLVDCYDKSKGWKYGDIIKCFSRGKYKVADMWFGPYPRIYLVKWKNGRIGKYLPHGLSKA